MLAQKRHIKSFSKGFIDGLSDLFGLHYTEPKCKNIIYKSHMIDKLEIKDDWNNVLIYIETSVEKFEGEELEYEAPEEQ